MRPVFAVVPVAALCFVPTLAPAQGTAPSEYVEGRVVDLHGQPVPAAAIAVSTWQDPDVVVARGTSDGDGCFRVTKLPAADGWTIRASAHDRVSSGEQANRERRTVTVRMFDTASVTGTLTDRAGSPVPHAIVRAELLTRIASRIHADATTDEQGRFALRAPLGRVQIAAIVPGEGIATQQERVAGDCVVALAPDDRPKIDLRVRLEGVTAAAMGQVRLSVRPYGDRRYEPFPPPWHEPRFDASGTWSIEHAPACKYTIYASSSDFSFAPRQIAVPAGSGSQDLEFTATPIGTTTLPFAARALDAAGKPVAGVAFELRAPNGGTRTRAVSDAGGDLVFASPLALGEEAVVTSVDAAWVTDQTLPARERMMHGDETQQLHHCRIGTAPVELRIVPACTVSGRLVRADGSPAGMVDVALEYRSTGWPEWHSFDAARTDRDGVYAFAGLHHVAMPVRVAVAGADGTATSDAVAIAEIGSRVELGPLTLRPPAVIEGIVRGADQQPAAGVTVWLRDWDLATNRQASGSVVETITDRDGRYRFVGVPEGGAWLQLVHGDESPTGRAIDPFAVESGKTYSFDLQHR